MEHLPRKRKNLGIKTGTGILEVTSSLSVWLGSLFICPSFPFLALKNGTQSRTLKKAKERKA